MKHKPLNRIVPNAKTAVLFIHGIVGTPNHFNQFIPQIPKHISICNMLLEGHGGTTADFSAASMQMWEEQVDTKVSELLLSHSEVYIVAHSMGTLFAIDQAIHRSGVVGLFLLAVPLEVFVKPQAVANSLKVQLNRVDSNDAAANAAVACYGIETDKNLLHYVGWAPRFMELLQKIRETRRILPQLKTKAYVYQSEKDELVSMKSSKLLEKLPCVTQTILHNSGHFYYPSYDWEILIQGFQKLIVELDKTRTC